METALVIKGPSGFRVSDYVTITEASVDRLIIVLNRSGAVSKSKWK